MDKLQVASLKGRPDTHWCLSISKSPHGKKLLLTHCHCNWGSPINDLLSRNRVDWFTDGLKCVSISLMMNFLLYYCWTERCDPLLSDSLRAFKLCYEFQGTHHTTTHERSEIKAPVGVSVEAHRHSLRLKSAANRYDSMQHTFAAMERGFHNLHWKKKTSPH